MKLRLYSRLKYISAFLGVGFLYYLLITFTDFGFVCIFNALTGLLCPGCGVSRMIISSLRLDFVSAFHYNPVLFVTFPMMLGIYIFWEIKYIRTGSKELGKFSTVMLGVECAVLLIFGVVRNVI